MNRLATVGRRAAKSLGAPDPAEVAVIGHALRSVATEMGAALRRTAFSPNIKERRDYSSAVFSGDGELIAMGDDMPVHLGSMPMSVSAALRWAACTRDRWGRREKSPRRGFGFLR